MSARPYAIVDGTSTCINVCSWDGDTPWSPPPGCEAIDISTVSPQPGIGWTYIGRVWAAPVPVPPPPYVAVTSTKDVLSAQAQKAAQQNNQPLFNKTVSRLLKLDVKKKARASKRVTPSK